MRADRLHGVALCLELLVHLARINGHLPLQRRHRLEILRDPAVVEVVQQLGSAVGRLPDEPHLDVLELLPVVLVDREWRLDLHDGNVRLIILLGADFLHEIEGADVGVYNFLPERSTGIGILHRALFERPVGYAHVVECIGIPPIVQDVVGRFTLNPWLGALTTRRLQLAQLVVVQIDDTQRLAVVDLLCEPGLLDVARQGIKELRQLLVDEVVVYNFLVLIVIFIVIVFLLQTFFAVSHDAAAKRANEPINNEQEADASLIAEVWQDAVVRVAGPIVEHLLLRLTFKDLHGADGPVAHGEHENWRVN